VPLGGLKRLEKPGILLDLIESLEIVEFTK